MRFCFYKRNFHGFFGKIRKISVRIIPLAVVLIIVIFFRCTLEKAIISFADREAENKITALLSETVHTALAVEDVSYSSLISSTVKSDGTPATLSVNYVACHRICADLLKTLSSSTAARKSFAVNIPIGSLTGFAFLSGKGPAMTVTVRAASGITARLIGEFKEAGINQTLHRISLSVTVRYSFLFPSGKEDREITIAFPIAETVLLGTVPDAFTRINRLTDDISENEIDDIYDFGATVGE